MTNKEVIERLTKYVNLLKLKISSNTPEKQKKREKQYKDFLQKDLQITMAKIESLKMAMPAEAKK